MTRRFAVDGPEQLRELRARAIMSGDELRIASLAAVWSADRRRNGGRSKWDGRVFVSFECGKQRAPGARWHYCYVARIASSGEILDEGELHYNKALRWCEGNLRREL